MDKIRLQLDRDDKNLALVRAMGSKNKLTSWEAQEIFAALADRVIYEVLQQAGTTSGIFKDIPFGKDEPLTLPLDIFRDVTTDHISIWSQTVPGGLPTNLVQGLEEIRFNVFRLDTAVSVLKQYAQRSRVDVLAKVLERVAQTILVKQEATSWVALLNILANASTTNAGNGNVQKHVIKSELSNGSFSIQDLNNLLILMKRNYSSWAGGTPIDGAGRLTDLYVSPEVMGDIRAFAYNPVNTRGAFKSDGTEMEGVVPMTDSQRERIWNNGGMAEIWGVALHELIELGPGQSYTDIFADQAGSTTYEKFGGGSAEAFGAGDDIVIGLDLTRDAFLRPVITDDETGSTFTLEPDDQFVRRSEKLGWYGSVQEGRLITENRAAVGVILDSD